MTDYSYIDERLNELTRRITAIEEAVTDLQVNTANDIAFLKGVRDDCEICLGAKGGIPGNEVLFRGHTVCDYCHAKLMDIT